MSLVRFEFELFGYSQAFQGWLRYDALLLSLGPHMCSVQRPYMYSLFGWWINHWRTRSYSFYLLNQLVQNYTWPKLFSNALVNNFGMCWSTHWSNAFFSASDHVDTFTTYAKPSSELLGNSGKRSMNITCPTWIALWLLAAVIVVRWLSCAISTCQEELMSKIFIVWEQRD